MNYIRLMDNYFNDECYGIIVTDVDVDTFQKKINDLKKEIGDDYDVEIILENIPKEWNWNIIELEEEDLYI